MSRGGVEAELGPARGRGDDLIAMTTVPPPTPPPPPASWRKRHPVLARAVLYGALVAVLGVGTLVALAFLERGRQEGLVTRIQGAQQIRAVDPERSLRILRDEVLSQRPNADVSRSARLEEAAVLDFLHRYDEADRVYASVEADWLAGSPKGALYVPWANLLVSAGQPERALRMLDAPGATDGWPVGEVVMVRNRAKDALAAAKAGMSGGG